MGQVGQRRCYPMVWSWLREDRPRSCTIRSPGPGASPPAPTHLAWATRQRCCLEARFWSWVVALALATTPRSYTTLTFLSSTRHLPHRPSLPVLFLLVVWRPSALPVVPPFSSSIQPGHFK